MDVFAATTWGGVGCGIRPRSAFGRLAQEWLGVGLGAAIALSPGHDAWSATEDPFDHPATAIPISPPGSLPFIGPGAVSPQDAGSKVLFVNFDGAEMRSCGSSNAPEDNCSTIFDGTVMPYSGSSTARAAIIQVVRSKLTAFDIAVTDTRPNRGDYDMAMVGNWDPEPDGGNFAGIAPGIDCWDMAGGQTSFSLEYTSNADGMAEVILQEIAHTWGLSHVSDLTDLLFPTTQGQGKTFKDECLEIVDDATLAPGTSPCSHHLDACDSDALQNAHAELLMIFGPGEPDTTPPTLSIEAPKPNAIYKWPEERAFDLDVILDLDDNNQPTLFVVYLQLVSDALPEVAESQYTLAGPIKYVQALKNLPYGDYALAVEIQDEAGLVASSVVDFSVVEGEPDVDGACECTSGEGRGPAVWWGLLSVLLTPTRRRRTR